MCFFLYQNDAFAEENLQSEDQIVPDQTAAEEKSESFVLEQDISTESSDESDEEDVREMEGRIITAKGQEVCF